MIRVECVNDQKSFYMDAETPLEAMQKMRYTLDLKKKDPNAVIQETYSGLHLWMEHTGKTYAVAAVMTNQGAEIK